MKLSALGPAVHWQVLPVIKCELIRGCLQHPLNTGFILVAYDGHSVMQILQCQYSSK